MIVSRNSKKKIFHEPDCPYVKRISDKYRKALTLDQARSKGYRPCSWCGNTHGLYWKMTKYPKAFPEEISKMKLSFDKDWKAICFNTGTGFWKMMWSNDEAGYRLYHLNKDHYSTNAKDTQLMRRQFHRQKDVKTTKRIGTIVTYIFNHDKAKRIMKDDWKKLPRQTQQQKEYYNKVKKKERRKSIRRVEDIFKQLERERKNKNG